MRRLFLMQCPGLWRWTLAFALVLACAGGSVAQAWNRRDQVNLAYQIALAEADFSPGILDGQFGPNSQMALKQYTQRFFPGANPYNSSDAQVYKSLHVDVKHAVATYTISSKDAALVGASPDKWQQMAKLSSMPYRSLRDCIAEKFHCTKGLLRRLNPGIKLSQLTVGETLRVPNIQPFPKPGPLPEPPPTDFSKPGAAAYIIIDEGKKTIRVYNAAHQQIALFHCSVAQYPDKLPVGQTVVKDMALNPDYTFNPKEWGGVHGVHHVLIIPPGPRNPVGLCWMGLNLPGYGMHGNAYPQNIGHTGSHGCFRMTNWDALTLFAMVRVGTPVKFIDNPLHKGSGSAQTGVASADNGNSGNSTAAGGSANTTAPAPAANSTAGSANAPAAGAGAPATNGGASAGGAPAANPNAPATSGGGDASSGIDQGFSVAPHGNRSSVGSGAGTSAK